MPAMMRGPGEGQTIGLVGDIYRFLATGSDTDGRYAMLEARVPPGGGPPPHVHSREDETFFVLDGEMTFQVGDRSISAAAGTFVHMPAGTPHTFRNESDRPVRMLIGLVPAGLERMFLECGVPLDEGAAEAPPASEPEIARLLEAAPRYGIEIRLPSP